MFTQTGESLSQTLTALLQGAVKKFGITIYIVPEDVGVEISIVDTKTIMNKQAYNLAVTPQKSGE